MNPILRALKALGGSGSIEEIYGKVVELEQFPDEIISQSHGAGKSDRTEIEYRLAWARTYLKKAGYLDNSSRGIWALTPQANQGKDVNPQEVVKLVRAEFVKSETGESEQGDELTASSEDSGWPKWKEHLHGLLTQQLSAAAFERLVQRVLRESGFSQVEVTGRSGDGGIDGRGIARIHGVMSFHVSFQCKRYKGAVGPSEIRDFRGAMVGRTEKGLFITTGTFTPAAVKEATRDGAPPIDLLDGSELADKLKELRLGVDVKTSELVLIDEGWFQNI